MNNLQKYFIPTKNTDQKEEEEEDKLDYWIFGLGSDLR